jgi:hypothetical protein
MASQSTETEGDTNQFHSWKRKSAPLHAKYSKQRNKSQSLDAWEVMFRVELHCIDSLPYGNHSQSEVHPVRIPPVNAASVPSWRIALFIVARTGRAPSEASRTNTSYLPARVKSISQEAIVGLIALEPSFAADYHSSD